MALDILKAQKKMEKCLLPPYQNFSLFPLNTKVSSCDTVLILIYIFFQDVRAVTLGTRELVPLLINTSFSYPWVKILCAQSNCCIWQIRFTCFVIGSQGWSPIFIFSCFVQVKTPPLQMSCSDWQPASFPCASCEWLICWLFHLSQHMVAPIYHNSGLCACDTGW